MFGLEKKINVEVYVNQDIYKTIKKVKKKLLKNKNEL